MPVMTEASENRASPGRGENRPPVDKPTGGFVFSWPTEDAGWRRFAAASGVVGVLLWALSAALGRVLRPALRRVLRLLRTGRLGRAAAGRRAVTGGLPAVLL